MPDVYFIHRTGVFLNYCLFVFPESAFILCSCDKRFNRICFTFTNNDACVRQRFYSNYQNCTVCFQISADSLLLHLQLKIMFMC